MSLGETDDEAIPSQSVSELISDDLFREQGLIVADQINDGLEDDMFTEQVSSEKQSDVLEQETVKESEEDDSQDGSQTSRAPIYEPGTDN